MVLGDLGHSFSVEGNPLSKVYVCILTCVEFGRPWVHMIHLFFLARRVLYLKIMCPLFPSESKLFGTQKGHVMLRHPHII